MKRVLLAAFVLLLMLSTCEAAEDAEMQHRTCGYRGQCRRFCYAQEYIVGHHGCPQRYRWVPRRRQTRHSGREPRIVPV
ncbi:unnamed protein product [Merluccius merluccius]